MWEKRSTQNFKNTRVTTWKTVMKETCQMQVWLFIKSETNTVSEEPQIMILSTLLYCLCPYPQATKKF